MKLPVILPEIRINFDKKGGFQFEFNNCEGGTWETIVFSHHNGELIFISFNTPVVKNGITTQNAIASLKGTKRFTEGVKGAFKLVNPHQDSDGVIRKTLIGTLNLGSETFVEGSDGVCSTVYEDTKEIELKDIAVSRRRPFDFESVRSDLRALPGLKREEIRKMCAE